MFHASIYSFKGSIQVCVEMFIDYLPSSYVKEMDFK